MQSFLRRSRRSRLLNTSAAALLAFPAAMASGGAFAQDQDQDDTLEDDVETVIVTGSRIRRAGFDTVQPATVIDSVFMDQKGFDNAAQALNEIPQFGLPSSTNAGGQAANNVGQNIVNLFGLGSQRTLVLINGRRTVGQNTPNVGGVSGGLQVDLNIIPTGMIERIETIETGGAPIYGADAIAGTVNIILKDDFEGVTADVQYGMNQHGEAKNFRFRSLLGGNFADGRGNVVMSFEYSKQHALDARDRPSLINSPGFVPNAQDTGPADGIVDTLFMDDILNVWQVPNTGFILFQNDAVSGVQDEDGNPTYESFVNGEQVLPNNAAGDLVILGFDGELVTLDSANLGTPFPSAVSFFSFGADGENNDFVSELDELNTFVSPLERFTMNANGHYDINDNVTLFYEGLYSRSESVDNANQPSWSTLFFHNANNGALGNYRINIGNNPFVSQEIRDVLAINERPIQVPNPGFDDTMDPDPVTNPETIQAFIPVWDPSLVDDPETGSVDESDQFFWVTRSNVDILGDSKNFRDQDVFRFVAGFEGDVDLMGRLFDWEIAYTFGQTNSTQLQSVINGARLSFATDVVLDDRLNGDGDPLAASFGTPICRITNEGITELEDDGGLPGSGTNADIAGCTPINILDFGSITDEAKLYVLQRQAQQSRLQQSVVEASIAGDLFELPGGPLGVAMGVTHRRERASFSVGQGSQIGPPPNPPQADIAGGFNTWEVYGEILAPLVSGGEGMGFLRSIFDRVEFEGAIRLVDNNFAGADYTWTIGGRATPRLFDGLLTVRGNYTEAIRSPSVTELFLPQVSIGTFAIDPCDQRDVTSGNNPTVRAANCASAVAALAGTLDPTFDLNIYRAISRNASQAAITGGNPNLNNEQSVAYSFGVILQPDRWVPGLRISIDYTDITIDDAIVNLSATNIMAACFDSPSFPNEAACQRFERDPVSFQPSNFITGFVNAANRRFEGLTVQATYDFDLADLVSAFNGNMRLTANYFKNLQNDQQVGAADRAFFVFERGFEKHKYQINLAYNLNRFSGFVQLRGDFGGIFNFDDFRQPGGAGLEARDIQKFDGYHEVSLSARYLLRDNLWLQANLNNALNAKNTKLRQASVGSNGNILDDPIGRRFLVSVGANF